MLRSISEWCGNVTKLGEFWCSASINDFQKQLVTTILKKEGRSGGSYYLRDPPDWAKKLSNTSSMVSRTELDSFINKLVSKKLGFPVFSISDCNSFHTSGYLWGKYAIVNNPQNAPVAVLNFDSHSDLGDASTSYVRSDGWGAPLVSDAPGCYVSMDASGKFLVGSYNNGTDAKSVASGNVFTKDFWGNVNKNIKKDIKYVFISVDRDCLKDHLTQWKYVQPKTSISKLKETMDKVCIAITSASKEDVSLIGFDVTGLPENQIMDTNAKTVFIANDGKHTDWDAIRGELQELLGWVKTAPLRPTSPQPSKPASTGGKAPTAAKQAVPPPRQTQTGGKAPTGKTPPARPTSPHPEKPISTDKPASKSKTPPALPTSPHPDKPASKGKTPPARPTSPHPEKPTSTDKPASKSKAPSARPTRRQTRK